MRILYLAHRIPYPPDKGEKIRSFHQLRFLANRGSVDLFCFAGSEEEAAGKRELAAFCRQVHVEILRPRAGLLCAAACAVRGGPFSLGYYRSASLRKEVQRAVARENYDLIFVYCSAMAQYVPPGSPVATVIDFVDADSSKWAQYARSSAPPLSWLYKCEAERLARYEKQLTQVFGTSIVASKAEAQELGGGGCHGVCVVENGVSAPSVKDEAALPEAISQLQPYVVFVGTMNYRPNVDAVVYFTEEILPLVRQRHPELRFLIVGRDPARPVRKLTRLPGVVVTGSVPDVSPYLAGARVAVAPFRIAQGVQNKVLEALARGLPVVLTSRSARPFSSLPAQTLLVADTPKDFAEAVISALEDPLVARRCQAAAAHVRERFDWQNHFAQLSHLLEERAVSPGSAAGRVPNYVSIS